MKDHLLVNFRLDDHLLDRLRRDDRFASVSYHPAVFVEGTAHPDAVWSHEPPEVPGEVWRRCTVQMTMFTTPPASAEAVPHLRFVQAMSAGVEHLLPGLLPLLRAKSAAIEGTGGRRDVESSAVLRVATASGVHATTIAEYCLRNILDHHHRLPVLQSVQRDARWARTRYVPPGRLDGSVELRGKRIGVFGYGSIGREVARLAAAFGMTVLAATFSGTRCAQRGFTVPGTGDPEGALPVAWYASRDEVQLREFLGRCDVLVLAAPLTEQTRGVMNAERLSHLPGICLLVNVGRGSLVETEALVDALEGDRLAGAVLDVTDPEPLPDDHRLWSTKNCVVTPHIAGAGQPYETRCVDLLGINLDRMKEGKEPFNAVDALKGY